MVSLLRKKLKWIVAIGIIILVGFAVYRNYFAYNKKKIEKAEVKRGVLEEKLTISGTIDAEEKVTLRFQTLGRLAWVGVKEGDYVKKYQGIAALDVREVKKNLQKKLDDYLTERWNFEQKRDDYNVKTQSPLNAGHLTVAERRIIEKAQYTLDKSVLDVEIQNLAVEYANLWTPIEGIVTKVGSPYAGINISLPTQAEFEIVNPNTVYFAALADQTEVTKLEKCKLGELTLDAYSEATLSGNIKDISFAPKAGETGTVYTVKFYFNDDNSSYKYRLGMGGDLTFVTERKEDVLYIPVKFVKTENGKKYLKVKKNGKEEKVYVETGMEADNSIEITSGIAEGTVVYD